MVGTAQKSAPAKAEPTEDEPSQNWDEPKLLPAPEGGKCSGPGEERHAGR